MSLRILKAGILDSFQDMGRYGFQNLGINPTGSMDRYSAGIANMLVGNGPGDALIEMHFPSSVFLFDEPAIIALAGADFNASINGEFIPAHQPLMINKSSVLQFHNIKNGARCYLAVRGGFSFHKWLGSYSTNLKAEAGGFDGRKLRKDDVIELKGNFDPSKILGDNDFRKLPWKANKQWNENEQEEILILPGNEWNWLDPISKQKFISRTFSISNNSDRMGYRLTGDVLQKTNHEELISSAVCFGTIQLLPDGQIIILMADHQTTGGYPRIGNVITTDLPRLAQMKAGETIHFSFTDQKTAEELFIKQQQHLLQLQNACTFRLENFIHENN
jgi:antagonist of KipI